MGSIQLRLKLRVTSFRSWRDLGSIPISGTTCTSTSTLVLLSNLADRKSTDPPFEDTFSQSRLSYKSSLLSPLPLSNLSPTSLTSLSTRCLEVLHSRTRASTLRNWRAGSRRSTTLYEKPSQSSPLFSLMHRSVRSSNQRARNELMRNFVE